MSKFQYVMLYLTNPAIHCLGDCTIFHFLCPAGLAILPNLLRFQWLEVCLYVDAIEPRISGKLANCRI